MIESRNRVFLRRGVIRVVLEGEGIAGLVARLQEVATDEACAWEDLLALFPAPERETIDALLRHLLRRNLAFTDAGEGAGTAGDRPAVLPSGEETGEDIFFWHAGRSRDEVRRATSTRLALVGVNSLSVRLRQRLGEYGRWEVDLIDDVPLRNHAMCADPNGLPRRQVADASTDERLGAAALLVACSEFGGQSLLMPWNSLAIARGLPFLPVLIEDLAAYVGPLTIPGETACLACLAARQNSNLQGASDRREMEPFAVEGQRFAAAHPAMVDLAAGLAAFEVLRFAVGLFPRRIGKLIEFNLVSSAMIAQRVLKVPRCPACSSLKEVGLLGIEKRLADAATWDRIERMGGAYEKKA